MARAGLIAPFLLLACIAPAAADDAVPNIGPRTLAMFPQGVERCYRATFDAAARKGHAGQVLGEFMLYRLLRPDPSKETVGRTAEDEVAYDKSADVWNWVAVLAKLADGKGYYSQSIVCSDSEDNGGVRCGVECDGGSFAMKKDGDSLALSFEPDNGLSLNQSCGDPDEEGHDHWLTATEAGGAFTLPLQPVESCLAADREARPAFAADPVPLRERVATSGWRCLSRVYDKAHLQQHPKQKVSAIAVAIKGPVTVEADESGWKTTHLAVTLSVATRDGKHGSQDVDCIADQFQYRCGGEFRLRRRDAATAMLLAGEFAAGAGETAPKSLNGVAIGPDDLIFKLDGGTGSACGAEPVMQVIEP